MFGYLVAIAVFCTTFIYTVRTQKMIGKQGWHYFRFLLGTDKPETQTTINEQFALRKYATGSKVAIEIGVFEGFNTALIANSIACDGVLYGIDPFFKGILRISWQKEITKRYLRREKVSSKVKLIEDISSIAATAIPDDCDFIFVDGDHSLQGITKDWLIYSNKLRRGGIIALHDTSAPQHQAWKSEMSSVQYFQRHIKHVSGFKILETIDSLNVMQKL